MAIVIPPIAIQFDSDNDVIIDLPGEYELYINKLQLETNCGFNMFDKKLKFILQGDENEFELPVVTISQMYKFQIPSELFDDTGGWRIRRILIRPCQKNNYPVFLSVRAAD